MNTLHQNHNFTASQYLLYKPIIENTFNMHLFVLDRLSQLIEPGHIYSTAMISELAVSFVANRMLYLGADE